jgi:streptomycin 6-kinase
VLSARREPWLVIDPKPVIGDRGFDLVRLVIDGVHDAGALRERLALVEDLTGVDREHARRWALARCVDFALWHTDQGYEGDGGHAAAALLAGLR